MRVKKIKFRNFCSYGDDWQEVSFPDNGSITQIFGKNGTGKSSLLNVVKFLLYGQCDRTKASLPNRVNKKLEVSGEFEISGKSVSIERKVKPDSFTVHIDGMEVKQAGVSNIQNVLESEIRMSYEAFSNLIIVSVEKFKSFISMKAQTKREIIDDLFEFTDFNAMKEQAKKDYTEHTAKLDRLKSSLSETERSIESIQRKIAEATSTNVEQFKAAIELLDMKIQVSTQNVENAKKEVERLESLYKEASRKLLEASRETIAIDSDARACFSKYKLYEANKCPTCECDLTTGDHTEKKASLLSNLQAFKSKISAAKELEGNLKNESEGLAVSLSKAKESLMRHHSDFSRFNSERLANKSALERNAVPVELKSLLSDSEARKAQILSEMDNAEEKASFHKKVMDSYFNDSNGLKAKAIEMLIPILNSKIADISALCSYEFNMEFDSKFDCKITHLGHEIDPETLSTGEKKKSDMIVLLSILEIIMLKYPKLNMLFLDELFSSLDQDSVKEIVGILKAYSVANSVNVIVIAHNELPAQDFDLTITTEKENGFSKIKTSR